MGVEIKLSDRELPVSSVFIDFLHHLVAEIPFTGAMWGDQLSEAMNNEQRRLQKSVTEHAQLTFEVFADNGARHPDWMRKAEPVVQRVADVWATVGLPFPRDEVMQAW